MTSLPRITLVTPSFQQAPFLERTIRSILDQNYPNLEYFIFDAGSTDGSVDIIRRHSGQLAEWHSEPDRGQASAINKGLRKATGEILGWLNSDDTLAPNALRIIADEYARRPEIDLLFGHTALIDAQDHIGRRLCAAPTNAYELIHYNRSIFSQPGTTWRKRLSARIGYLDESLHCVLDADFWIRAAQNGQIGFVPSHLGNLRTHELTKTRTQLETFEAEHRILDGRYGPRNLSPITRAMLNLRRKIKIMTNPRTLAYRFGMGQARHGD